MSNHRPSLDHQTAGTIEALSKAVSAAIVKTHPRATRYQMARLLDAFCGAMAIWADELRECPDGPLTDD